MKLKIIFVIAILFINIPLAYSGVFEDVEVLLNKERSIAGRPPLTKSVPLMMAAQAHADDMLKQKYFSHVGKNGSDHSGRIRRAGYNACYTAENIARGQRTANVLMSDWMRSEGHRNNILSGRPDHYGIGRAGNVWVLVFASGC